MEITLTTSTLYTLEASLRKRANNTAEAASEIATSLEQLNAA
jgi:hypothetical protein